MKDSGMAQARGARSVLATIVGYVLVGVVAYFVLRWLAGTLFWLIRTLVVVLVIGLLLTLYVKLKLPKN